MKKILITGGAGFVGSNLSIDFKRYYENCEVIVLDNLRRTGSHLNLERLKQYGVTFIHGDVRSYQDLESLPTVDLLIEASAEPSVNAGYGNSASHYCLDTNLVGAIHCLEWLRQRGGKLIFLSSSRVYPIGELRRVPLQEYDTRFDIPAYQTGVGYSSQGIQENFPLFVQQDTRSLYGASKLSAELLVLEYAKMYGVPAIVNRCGVLTGPWQMGKVDQGFVALWVARHYFKMPLQFIGFGGQGKQLRDILHVKDLFDLLQKQLNSISKHQGIIYNVGGGKTANTSLLELTRLCQTVTEQTVPIARLPETRAADIPYYVSDTMLIQQATDWKPQYTVEKIVQDVFDWINKNSALLKPIFCE